jgi:NAD(P)-dependent dehydrogenase (short-subunit alcohol dehydrogenase family)
MSQRLAGKVALVTGAGNGIGRAIALQLAAEGAAVVVNDLGTDTRGLGSTRDVADACVAEIAARGGNAVANYDSVAEAAGCERAVRTALEAFGQCDIVVANAGALLDGALHGLAVDDDSWRRLLDLYLSQKFWLARSAVPAMLERGWGRIVFATSEIARGEQANPLGAAVFSGGIGMVRDLATQHRGTGVTFNCFAPGAATRLFDVYKAQIDAQLRDRGVPEDQWSAHYLPPPECIAPMVTWLCTDAASTITGEVFGVAGGTVTRWSHHDIVAKIVKHTAPHVWELAELDERVPSGLFGEQAPHGATDT